MPVKSRNEGCDVHWMTCRALSGRTYGEVGVTPRRGAHGVCGRAQRVHRHVSADAAAAIQRQVAQPRRVVASDTLHAGQHTGAEVQERLARGDSDGDVAQRLHDGGGGGGLRCLLDRVHFVRVRRFVGNRGATTAATAAAAAAAEAAAGAAEVTATMETIAVPVTVVAAAERSTHGGDTPSPRSSFELQDNAPSPRSSLDLVQGDSVVSGRSSFELVRGESFSSGCSSFDCVRGESVRAGCSFIGISETLAAGSVIRADDAISMMMEMETELASVKVGRCRLSMSKPKAPTISAPEATI